MIGPENARVEGRATDSIAVLPLLTLGKFLSTRRTFEAKQTEIFSELSEKWWDVNGVLKPLHAMNLLRIPWIRDRLGVIGAFKPSATESTPFSGLSFLDVGCGGGVLSEPLSRLGADVVGLDCNSDMLNLAVSRLQKKQLLNLNYVQSTIDEYVDENTEKYDVVVASEVIEHVEEKGEFIKGCVKCLKPGGSIFVTTNSKSPIAEFLAITVAEKIFRLVPEGTHQYEMFVDIDDLKQLLQRELTTVEMEYTNINLNNRDHVGLIRLPDISYLDFYRASDDTACDKYINVIKMVR
ncbi:ubiquinone biosynthesis O-methyltransferase-like [Zophobas morio]|uniref:ubiquinone biosynthesis O-methyltransferase-like n=1 Tax=Zophobas morio TaxID=2755281 RepID=UPI003083AED8